MRPYPKSRQSRMNSSTSSFCRNNGLECPCAAIESASPIFSGPQNYLWNKIIWEYYLYYLYLKNYSVYLVLLLFVSRNILHVHAPVNKLLRDKNKKFTCEISHPLFCILSKIPGTASLWTKHRKNIFIEVFRFSLCILVHDKWKYLNKYCHLLYTLCCRFCGRGNKIKVLFFGRCLAKHLYFSFSNYLLIPAYVVDVQEDDGLLWF